MSQALNAIGIPILFEELTLPENQLPDRAHEPGCSKPRSIPWYTRGRNTKGDRTWVLGILSCPECGKSVMQPYRVNLTKKQKEKFKS